VDRLDYLRRDSFFSGVAEGAIGEERIIKMLEAVNDEVVVEAKGMHSVEKFLIARRLMYWQVYLHKTVIAAEQLLVNIFARAKSLVQQGAQLFATEALLFFLRQSFDLKNIGSSDTLRHFALLSDSDVDCAVKAWCSHSDKVLSTLCQMLVARKLPKVEIQDKKFAADRVAELQQKTARLLNVSVPDTAHFVQTDVLVNKAYSLTGEPIRILYKTGELRDIYEASDMLNATAFRQDTTKYFLSYPKELA
jgi:HD superfamily phosphohydrolase